MAGTPQSVLLRGFLDRPVLAVGASGRYISARFPRNERLYGGAEQEGRALMARQFVYHMQGLSKTYPGHRKVLENVNLSFYPDAKIGVLGVNGSGKSTLLSRSHRPWASISSCNLVISSAVSSE